MKNILAENLLRFGVKNLKESDKKKLIELDPGDPISITPEFAQKAYASVAKEIQTYNEKFNKWTKNKANGGKGLVLFLAVPASGDNTIELRDANSNRNQPNRWIMEYDLDNKKLTRKVMSGERPQNIDIAYDGRMTGSPISWSIGNVRNGVKLNKNRPNQKNISDAIYNAAWDLWSNYLGLQAFFKKLSEAPAGTTVKELGVGTLLLNIPASK